MLNRLASRRVLPAVTQALTQRPALYRPRRNYFFYRHIKCFNTNSNTTLHNATEFVTHEVKELSKLLEATGQIRRWLIVTGVVLASSTLAIIVNWSAVRKRVGKESAEALRESIADQQLRIAAARFSEALFRDAKLRDAAAEWFLRILQDNNTASAIEHLLQTPEVQTGARNLAADTVKWLCGEPWVAELIGKLLLDAINTPTAVAGAAKWCGFVLSGQTEASQPILTDTEIIDHVSTFLTKVAEKLKSEAEVVDAVETAIREALQSAELRDAASDCLWAAFKGSMLPRWLTRNSSSSLDKLLDEASTGESNIKTDEETTIIEEDKKFDDEIEPSDERESSDEKEPAEESPTVSANEKDSVGERESADCT